MKISVLIPCHNEERTIERCILSYLNQTRKPDEIIVVDDASTDESPALLKHFSAEEVKVIRTPKNTGNKSYAQEVGFASITGDIFITTDADSVLHPRFIEEVLKNFEDPKVAAVGGYVRSMRYNWLTACRAFEYATGQNLHKLAQSYLNFMFVIPGAAGAFRTDIFKKHLHFDHDTITEDLDFTYKLHWNRMRIAYNRNAVVYTQDPTTLKNYVNQMRRWYGGGWQNLMKHYSIVTRPAQALELSLIYIEGLVFSILIFLIPLLNLEFALNFVFSYLVVAFILAAYAANKERRVELAFVPLPYIIIIYINAYIFLEQFVREVILKQKNLVWFQPERVRL